MPRLLLLALLLAACSSNDAGGNACADCTLTLEPTVRLLPDERVSFVINTKVVQAANGNLFAAPIANRSSVAMYSPSGELLGVIGKRGPGPGELAAVEGIHAVGDSIFVAEDAGQVELFDASGEWRESIPVAGYGAGYWPLPEGRMVVRTGGTDGPLFVALRDNTGTRPLAGPTPRFGADFGLWRDVSTDPAGRVWTTLSRPGDELYRVAVLDPAGRDTAQWEQRYGAFLEPKLLGDPVYVARVSDLALAAPDTLMVLLHRALRNPPPPPKQEERGGEAVARMLTIDEATERYDFYLDVLSPETRGLVARLPLPEGWFGGFVRPGEIFSIEEREDLELVVQLWKAVVTTP